MNKQYLYVYLDETKNMSSKEACFGGVITRHRPGYMQVIYNRFLEYCNLNPKDSKEIKSFDKYIKDRLYLLSDLVNEGEFDIKFFGSHYTNYIDHIAIYKKIVTDIVISLKDIYDHDTIVMYADKIYLGSKSEQIIEQYVYLQTGIKIKFYFENSKQSIGLQLADLFCGMLRQKILFIYNQKDNIKKEMLALPIRKHDFSYNKKDE